MSCSCRRRSRLNSLAMVSKVSSTFGLSSASIAASDIEFRNLSLFAALLAITGRRGRLERRRCRRRRRRRNRLHRLWQTIAARHAFAGAHRRRGLLGVGAGIGGFKVNDIAQEDFAFVELVAPDDDGLE